MMCVRAGPVFIIIIIIIVAKYNAGSAELRPRFTMDNQKKSVEGAVQSERK
jgi:hypothetical protein